MTSFASRDRSPVLPTGATLEPAAKNPLDAEVGVPSNLRDDFLDRQRSTLPPSTAKEPVLIAQNAGLLDRIQAAFPAVGAAKEMEQVKKIAGADIANFAGLVRGAEGTGSTARIWSQLPQDVVQRKDGAILDWCTRPATDAYEKSSFMDSIDPGGKAEASLKKAILSTNGQVGLDDIYRKALTAVESTYGSKDGTTATVIMANLLKKACAEERGVGVDPNGYGRIVGKLENYRPDQSSCTDLYYHAATLGMIARVASGPIAELASAVENQDLTNGNDKYEAAFQTHLAAKLSVGGR